jgi:drug/metabolite transporter (DMT)-like permease
MPAARVQTTGATRGAFLVQSTSLFTPILATLFGMQPSKATWLGSVVALGGTLLVTWDRSGGGVAGAIDGLTAADGATLVAAACYSMSTVRIPAYAKAVVPLKVSQPLLALVFCPVSLLQTKFECLRGKMESGWLVGECIRIRNPLFLAARFVRLVRSP